MRFNCCSSTVAQPELLKAGDVIQLLEGIEGFNAGDICLVGRWAYSEPRISYLIRLCDGIVKGNLNLSAPNPAIKYRKDGFSCSLK